MSIKLNVIVKKGIDCLKNVFKQGNINIDTFKKIGKFENGKALIGNKSFTGYIHSPSADMFFKKGNLVKSKIPGVGYKKYFYRSNGKLYSVASYVDDKIQKETYIFDKSCLSFTHFDGYMKGKRTYYSPLSGGHWRQETGNVSDICRDRKYKLNTLLSNLENNSVRSDEYGPTNLASICYRSTDKPITMGMWNIFHLKI